MKRNEIFIEADELLARLDDPNLRIFDAFLEFFPADDDALSDFEKYKAGHIPGAAFFDHQEFSDSSSPYAYTILPADKLAEKLGAIGISEESEIILYSDMMPTATRAWWLLYYAGHGNMKVLNGGLAAWKEAGGAIEEGVRQYEPVTYEAQFKPEVFADKEEVQAAQINDQVVVINTLPDDFADGALIAGSSRLSCLNMMDEFRVLLPDEQILNYLQQGAQGERIITYCGGGFAATVNAIAHLIAGDENVAVYDGSLDEWMSEGLPLAEVNK